jgi:replicative DNA helicase Mcm
VEILGDERDRVEKVREIASDPRVLKRLVESVAPDIYGLKVVKEALLYSLIGGVREESNGHRKRGNIHLLIVGDPGTGKSQLLRFAAEAIPKSTMITGNYTNTEGLTVKITHEDNGTPHLVPGALIQADQGILALDKVDKLSYKDMDALQPAMAHQIIKIAKDGVNQTFDARTSVIASANPTLGRYNPYQTIAQNLSLSIPLLSCFDLIFIIRDIPDTCKDRKTAEHILFLGRKTKPSAGDIISVSDLRTYIVYARELKPTLSHEAAQHLVNFYVDMRSASLEGGEAAAISITVRQLEALVRIAEARAKAHLREEVLVEDAKAAIELMTRSLEQVGIDVETGYIDLDILYTGRPRSLNVRLFKVMATIEEMEKIDGLVRDDELYDTLYSTYSIPRTETASLVSKLLKEGTIYSPRPGYYKRSN